MIATVFDLFPQSSLSGTAAGTVVSVVNDTDVLCGKEKTHNAHRGNVLYRAQIALHASLYAAASTKHEKMKITKQIVNCMQQQHGAKFLRRCGESWVLVGDAAARDKTSHALRFHLKHLKKQSIAGASGAAAAASSYPAKSCMRRARNDDGSSSGMLHVLRQSLSRQSPTPSGGITFCAGAPPTTSPDPTSSNSSSGMDVDDGDSNKETFDTLRSEDLHAILNEPLHENDFDTIMTMVAC